MCPFASFATSCCPRWWRCEDAECYQKLSRALNVGVQGKGLRRHRAVGRRDFTAESFSGGGFAWCDFRKLGFSGARGLRASSGADGSAFCRACRAPVGAGSRRDADASPCGANPFTCIPGSSRTGPRLTCQSAAAAAGCQPLALLCAVLSLSSGCQPGADRPLSGARTLSVPSLCSAPSEAV